MNKLKSIQKICGHLKNGGFSIESWVQAPHTSIAERMDHGGYDWVAIDIEHGSICVHILPDLCSR